MNIGDEKNRGKRKIKIIENTLMGKDNAIRSIRIRAGKSVFERPDSAAVSNGITL